MTGIRSPSTTSRSRRPAARGSTGCTNTTEVDIECRLPLIGGKITDLVAKDTRRALDHEQKWMNEHLGAP